MRGEIAVRGPNWQPTETFKFLDISIPMWSKSSASPPLSGDCHWPLSINIPKDVVLPDFKQPYANRTYSLPQTFLERNSKVSAIYNLFARITLSRNLFHQDVE